MDTALVESNGTFLSSPLSAVPFEEFLGPLFQALEGQGIRPCVLRNYERFPFENAGGDIDFLIRPTELEQAVRALQSLDGVRIVGHVEHPHTASFFLAGVNATPGSSSILVDFYSILGLKGLSYFPVDTVLQSAVERHAGALSFLVPKPVHEAIISLLTSLIVSGKVKEKYFEQVQSTFRNHNIQVIEELSMQFGAKIANELVDAVVAGDLERVERCAGPMRRRIEFHCFLRRPISSLASVARFYGMEFWARYSPGNLESICVIGREGSAMIRLVDRLMLLLEGSANVVERRNARPPTGLGSGWFSGAGGVMFGLWTIWLRRLIRPINLVLRMNEGSLFDLIVDPKGTAYRGPIGLADLCAKLLPREDLWILLDGDSSKREVADPIAASDTTKSREAYRSFVRKKERYVIIDSTMPSDRVVESAYAAITGALARRTHERLRRRFD